MNDEKLDGGLSALTDVLGCTLDDIALQAARNVAPYLIGSIQDVTQTKARIQVAVKEALASVIEIMQTQKVELPERPEPDDCESLSFDAYSGFQMLAYGRACAEAQRLLMTPNAELRGATDD